MKSAIVALTFLAGLLSLPAATRAGGQDKAKGSGPVVLAPKISIDPMMVDRGTVAKGERIDTTFTVKNSGNADLIISDARPSCGCTIASFDRTIKPGQTGRINASVDTKNFSGPITKVVSVVSNDPENPQVNLTIKAVVKPYVDVLPQEFVRFVAIKGDTASQDVTLYSTEKDFHPEVEASSQPYVTAKIEPAPASAADKNLPGTSYKLVVSLGPTAPEGILNAPVKIKTGVAKQPEVEVRVSGIIRPRISVTPLALAFGNFTPGKDVISRNVSISNNKPAQPVHVLSADSDVSGLSVDVVPVTDGASYTIVVKPTDKLKKGAFSGAVHIKTDDKERPTIDVPVTGLAL